MFPLIYSWLVSEAEVLSEQDEAPPRSDWSEVARTISYFAMRLEPLVGTNTAFIACNRVGSEGGTSCDFKWSQKA